MKKIFRTESNSSGSMQIGSSIVINSVEKANTHKNMYFERKAMLPAYKPLIDALLKLPDKQVQARVLDAINDRIDKPKSSVEAVQICDKCKQLQFKCISVDVATQTTTTATNVHVNDAALSFQEGSTDSRTTLNNSDDTKKRRTSTSGIEVPVNEEVETEVEPTVKKKKQRRKLREPQVIKKSQAKLVQQQQKPIIQKRKSKVIASTADSNGKEIYNLLTEKRQRCDSWSSMDLTEAVTLAELWSSPVDDQTQVVNIMMNELRELETLQADGLIPIHSAIMNNDLMRLRRQVFVWQKKNINLNELYTEDGEDCLQLAVIQNKPCFILKVLVDNGLDLNSLDDQSNTLIHLAILNNVDEEMLRFLVQYIDPNMLLNLNDDGYTPLHLAVRQDNFLHAEIILNSIDKRCFGRQLYKREHKKDNKEDFLKFYEKSCEKLEIENITLQSQKENQQFIKSKLVDATDRCSGCTALFYAIENAMEHFIYFLLAHFSNPRLTNHSGQSVRAFFGEYSKTLKLSLNIDRVMEKIESALGK